MDPLMALMGQAPTEEQQRMMAQALRGQLTTGARLGTSTIGPVAEQGQNMQAQARDTAADIGRQKYMNESTENTRASILQRALADQRRGEEQDSPFNSITSSERSTALKQMRTDSQQAALLDTWTPDKQLQALGGVERWLTNKGLIPDFLRSDDSRVRQSWWKEYAEWENYVRNNLFGSALTGFELAAWNAANINPNMDPEDVMENVRIKRAIVRRAAAQQASVQRDFGWPKETLKKMMPQLPEEAWDDLDGYAAQQESLYRKNFTKNLEKLSDEELMQLLEDR